MVQPTRKDDAALILCQNNDKKIVEIQQVSESAAKVLGYEVYELIARPFTMVVGARVKEAIEEDVEYSESGRDVEDVIRKLRDFKIRTKSGEEIIVNIKILRDPAQDHHAWFRLILKDEQRQREERSVRTLIREHLAGVQVQAPITQLPDRYSAEQALNLVTNYVSSQGLQACFAAVRIDRHPKNIERYGKIPCQKLLQHVASCCQSKFRADDIVCQLSDTTMGMVLFDITPDSARVVLNRLRWFIASHRINFGGKVDFSVTVSVFFTNVTAESGTKALERIEAAVEQLGADERSALIEVVA